MPNFVKRLVLLTLGAMAFAQQPNTPTFEVASIKLNKNLAPWMGTGSMGVVEAFPGGRWRATGIPLIGLIGNTYHVWCCPMPAWQLTAGKGFESILNERYDIEAKAPEGAIAAWKPGTWDLEVMRPMVKTLLADRFKLAIRSETREGPVFALLVARNGPRFQRSKIDKKDCENIPRIPGKGCHAYSVQFPGRDWGLWGEALAMPDLVRYLLNYADRPLIDKTGLTGLFDLKASVPWPTDPSERFNAVLSVLERLGLKLESQRGPVESLVIDHVERPSEN